MRFFKFESAVCLCLYTVLCSMQTTPLQFDHDVCGWMTLPYLRVTPLSLSLPLRRSLVHAHDAYSTFAI